MTPTDIVLIALVWSVVGLTVAVWRVRRRYRNWIRSTDSDFSFVYDQLSALYRRVEALEDPHDTTADLDVPTVDEHLDVDDIRVLEDGTVLTDDDWDAITGGTACAHPTITPIYRPVPPDFHRNR